MQAEHIAGDEVRYASAIESVLLVAGEPVSTRSLTRLLDIDISTLRQALDYLAAVETNRGIRVEEHQGKLRFVTAPENAQLVRSFLELPRQPRLSRPALETLAIVAYRQPVTRGDIEQVRGVNVDRIIVSLQARGWIEDVGRRESPGRPIEYGTTGAFLELFGLLSLDDLPAGRADDPVPAHHLTLLGMETRAEPNEQREAE